MRIDLADRARDVLLISPHNDDIAYSLAGHLLSGRLDPSRCVLLTVFTVSEFAPYADPPVRGAEEISALRAGEDEAFARALGLSRVPLGLAEAPVRDRIPLEEIWVSEAAAAVHPAQGSLRKELAPVLTGRDWSLICLPLGFGGHVDHFLVRDAARAVVPDRGRLRFYEDLPYAGAMTAEEHAEAVARLTAGLRPEVVPESGWLQRKLALLRLYASQVHDRDLAAVVAGAARAGGERSWAPR